MITEFVLTQGGGHGHVLTVGVSIGPVVLRIALLAVVPVVAGFALLRGFLAEPGGRVPAGVIMCASGAVVLELLLSGGLNLSERLVPLLLAGLAVPLYLALSRDPRFAGWVELARRCAPWVFWVVAVFAAAQFAVAWLGGVGASRAETLLHTGVVLALVALAWFVVARTRRPAGTVGVRVGAAVLAMALIAGAGQATAVYAG